MKNTLLVTMLVAVIILFGLYFKERSKPPLVVEKPVTVEKRVEIPKEVIREVPVEKIINVPVEVIKEIPAKIPDEYIRALKLQNSLTNAKYVNSNDAGILRGIMSFNVRIYLNSSVKQLVDENQLRTKIELSLRRNGIQVSSESEWDLIYGIEGLNIKRKDGEDTKTLSYTQSLRVKQLILVPRDEGWFTTSGIIYEDSSYGVMPYDECSRLIDDAGSKIDGLSNKFLEQNPHK